MASSFLRVLKFNVGIGLAQSVTKLPITARVYRCMVEVTTAYSPGGDLRIGQIGAESKFLPVSDIDPTVTGLYVRDQHTLANSTLTKVSARVTGAPTAGAATVFIFWSDATDP